jgi:hypothetical protein
MRRVNESELPALPITPALSPEATLLRRTALCMYSRMAVFSLVSCIVKYLSGYVKGHMRRRHGRTHAAAAHVPVGGPGPSSGFGGSSSEGASSGDDESAPASNRFTNRSPARRLGGQRRDKSASSADSAGAFADESDDTIRAQVSGLLAVVGVACDWLFVQPSVADDGPVAAAASAARKTPASRADKDM